MLTSRVGSANQVSSAGLGTQLFCPRMPKLFANSLRPPPWNNMKTLQNFGEDFYGILKIGTKIKKNFGEDFHFFYFLLEIDRRMEQSFGGDFLFWQKNGTKLLEPTHLFLYRTAALFTGYQYFRNRKIVIVITFYSPSCLGQETAKGPFGLLVKLPPAHLSTTHGGGFTLSL